MKSMHTTNTIIASITGFCGMGERHQTRFGRLATHNKRINSKWDEPENAPKQKRQ